MVVDTSVLIAILQAEPTAKALVLAINAATAPRMSAASLLEAGIVILGRRADAGERELDALIREMRIHVMPFTADHAEIARSAFRRFGKGRHPAGLNFGDCFAYALA